MISTKGRYALKVMVELAEHDAEEYIPLKGIAEKLNISQKYLESISTILSKGHMMRMNQKRRNAEHDFNQRKICIKGHGRAGGA